MPYEIETAVLAGAVSLVGTAVTAMITRAQLISERTKVRHEIESVRQELHKEVLGRRITAYSALWKVMITYELNWSLEGRLFDKAWCWTILQALNDCNAEHGAFFAEPVYQRFVEYRSCILELRARTESGELLSAESVAVLAQISRGSDKKSGLATELKDGLGAYVSSYLQARTIA